MKLKILSFTGTAYERNDIISITVFTKTWEITILNNHMALVTAIKPCVMYIIYKDKNNITQKEDYAIWWWILEVNNSEVKIMIDSLVSVWDLDLQKAQEAKNKALELMEKYKNSKDKIDMERFIEAEDMLLKSIAQLKLWSIDK